MGPESIFMTDWRPLPSKEEIIASNDSFLAYGASKTLAEQALWKFADAHPEIDIMTCK
jgi:nucleoside-diphosphate-sugar epimerase